MSALRALIVENSENDCALLVRMLEMGGYEVHYKRVDSAEALRSHLDSQTWDVVISDHSMPGFSGTAVLAMVREKDPDVPCMFVSGTIGEEIAVNTYREGVHTYIKKGNLSRLVPTIRRELRDSESRRAHRNAQQRICQLEKFAAIGKLAGGIAHDFNNVIGAIMGWAELGEHEVAAGSPAEKHFQQIRTYSERAADLTQRLLAYARQQILEPLEVDLNQLIVRTTVLLQKVVGEQIEMEMVLSPKLSLTRADRSQIEQVLLNLCVNARDAMPEGGKLRIETCNVALNEESDGQHFNGRAGSYVRLSVSDTGVGIDAAILERIFEPFFTTKEAGKGTGLGLATTLGIVNQHGGSIEVESEIDKGTTFHVYLPVSEGATEIEESGQTFRHRENHDNFSR